MAPRPIWHRPCNPPLAAVISYLAAPYLLTGDVTEHHGTDDYWDVWILKLDGFGGIQWQKMLGGSYSDVAASIIQTSDGGYIFAGHGFSDDGGMAGHYGGTSQNRYIGKSWMLVVTFDGNILLMEPNEICYIFIKKA